MVEAADADVGAHADDAEEGEDEEDEAAKEDRRAMALARRVEK